MALSDGAFHYQEELLGFYGELHGELGHDLFGVAVDDEAYGFFGNKKFNLF